jgi:integrase
MRGGKFERRAGVWTVTVEAGRDPQTGKRRRITRDVRGGSRDADAALNDLVRQYARDELPQISGRTTVAEWLAMWIENWKAESASPKTLERYKQIIDHNIVPIIGHYRLRDLGADRVQAMYRQLGKDGMGEGGRRKVLSVLKAALNKARDVGAISRNVVSGVELKDYRPPEIKVLNEAEIGKLVAAAKESSSDLLYPAVVLAVTTGLRRGELLALKWEDIDWDAKTLTVRRSLEQTAGAPLRLKEPKTRSSRRTIGLMDETVRLLKHVRAQQAEYRMDIRANSKELAGVRDEIVASLLDVRQDVRPSREWAEEAVRRFIEEQDKSEGLVFARWAVVPELAMPQEERVTAAWRAILDEAEQPSADEAIVAANAESEEGQRAEYVTVVTSVVFGQPCMPTVLTRAFDRLTKRVKIECRFHDLRHTYASQLLANGVSPTEVAHNLGHATVATTLRTYAHFIPGGPDRAVAALESTIGPTLAEAMKRPSGSTKAAFKP